MVIINDADLGKKIRTFETDKPIRAPKFTPVRKEETVSVPERETVKVGAN